MRTRTHQNRKHSLQAPLAAGWIARPSQERAGCGWRQDRFQGRRRGFTLIELLVVISILSLLMTILMPALGRAREGGRSTVCLANVRRLAVAGVMYVDDEGAFPPFRMASLSPGVIFVNKYGRQSPRWQWFFDQGVGPVIDPAPYRVQGSFGDKDTLLMTNDYFICPSFDPSEFDRRDIRNGAYGYNWQYLGNARVENGRYQNFPVTLEKIRRPAATVMIADSRGGGLIHGPHSYTLDPPKVAREIGADRFGPGADAPIAHSPASARHNGRANVSFVDGHAESMSLADLGYVPDDKGHVVGDHPEASNRLWGQSR